MGYKMPTMLRVVAELPKSPTGKVLKRVLGPEIFPPQGHHDVQVRKTTKATSKL